MTVSRYATLGGKKLCDPAVLFEGVNRNRAPRDFWQLANSYTNPLGKEPGRAYVLLSRRDVAALGRNALHSLVWTTEAGATTFVNLAIVRATCMTLSHANDPDSTYLVELTDCRAQLKLSAINSQYNVRVPAGPRATTAEYYYPDSLDAGDRWRWQQMLDDIWGNLPAIAGVSPTLPYSPNGRPEGFRFIGVSAWDAFHEVLFKIGCALRYNPLTGAFSMVQVGQTQAGLAASEAALIATNRVYTYDVLAGNRPDCPATIRVFFHKRAEDGHGTERDTPRIDNWEMSPAYSEDVATGITGAETGTVLVVWDDLPALVDESGTVTNTSDLATRAAQVASNHAARFSLDEDRVHYLGCLTGILPGSEVAKVVWRDYSDGHGLLTEVHKGPMPPECCGDGAGLVENLAGPDLARRSHPVYPDLAQQLVVYHSSASFGEFVEANTDGLHPGYIVRVVDQTTEYLERVWILFTDNFEEWGGNVLAVQEWQYGPGRLSGVTTSGGETYPLYRVTHGDRQWMAVNQAAAAQGLPVDVEIWLFDQAAAEWGETGIVWPAEDWFLNAADTVPIGTKMIVKWHGPILVVTAAYCSASDDPIVEASVY